MVGSFWSHRRRFGEKRLCFGCQRDLQEAEETICVQKWATLRGEQEAKPLPVHQGRLLMVGHFVCGMLLYKEAIFDSHIVKFGLPATARSIFPCEALNLSFSNSDYGYYRHENTSECVRQSSAANKTLELCLNGEEDELLTAGYE